jgi:hypothetical protein
MVVGTVSERRFFHWSSWDKPPDSAQFDTRKAWTSSHYWQAKLNHKPEVPDEPLVLGPMRIEKGHPIAQLFHKLFSISKTNSELLKEYVFDEVREIEFPALPSRRRCMFLFDAEHDPHAYAKQLGFTPATLYEVTVTEGSLHRAKLSLLNCNSMSPPELRAQARLYWAPTEPSMDTELLFEGVAQLQRVE